ncbi:MAG TPA: hypothetical protein VD793_11225 [Gemmatimonadales bacterium]|nr:hypothetical protein [Gemmatimonadales bacterium]
MRGLFTYIETGVLAGALALVLYLTAARAVTAGTARAGIALGGVALGWFVILWELARLGAFEGGSGGWRVLVALTALAPAVIGAVRPQWLAVRLVSPGGGATVEALILAQVCRVVSGALLIALAGEALPAWAAVPPAAADLLVAGSAPALGRLVRRGDPRASGWVMAWSAGGIAAAAYLVSVVLLMGRTATYFLTLYPLVLIPVFVTPVVVALQCAAVAAVRQRTPGVPSA